MSKNNYIEMYFKYGLPYDDQPIYDRIQPLQEMRRKNKYLDQQKKMKEWKKRYDEFVASRFERTAKDNLRIGMNLHIDYLKIKYFIP